MLWYIFEKSKLTGSEHKKEKSLWFCKSQEGERKGCSVHFWVKREPRIHLQCTLHKGCLPAGLTVKQCAGFF